MGKAVVFSQNRVNIYMEHGVKDRGLMVAKYRVKELKDRYGTCSLSSLIKLLIVDEYRKMKRETEKLSKMTGKGVL